MFEERSAPGAARSVVMTAARTGSRPLRLILDGLCFNVLSSFQRTGTAGPPATLRASTGPALPRGTQPPGEPCKGTRRLSACQAPARVHAAQKLAFPPLARVPARPGRSSTGPAAGHAHRNDKAWWAACPNSATVFDSNVNFRNPTVPFRDISPGLGPGFRPFSGVQGWLSGWHGRCEFCTAAPHVGRRCHEVGCGP